MKKKREPEITYAVIYRVHHWSFPENEKFGGETVIQQSATSSVDEANDTTEMQAKRQACGYAATLGKTVFPDDVECTAKFIRTELRIDGRRQSSIVRAKRTNKIVTTKPVVPPPAPRPARQNKVPSPQPALTF